MLEETVALQLEHGRGTENGRAAAAARECQGDKIPVPAVSERGRNRKQVKVSGAAVGADIPRHFHQRRLVRARLHARKLWAQRQGAVNILHRPQDGQKLFLALLFVVVAVKRDIAAAAQHWQPQQDEKGHTHH